MTKEPTHQHLNLIAGCESFDQDPTKVVQKIEEDSNHYGRPGIIHSYTTIQEVIGLNRQIVEGCLADSYIVDIGAAADVRFTPEQLATKKQALIMVDQIYWNPDTRPKNVHTVASELTFMPEILEHFDLQTSLGILEPAAQEPLKTNLQKLWELLQQKKIGGFVFSHIFKYLKWDHAKRLLLMAINSLPQGGKIFVQSNAKVHLNLLANRKDGIDRTGQQRFLAKHEPKADKIWDLVAERDDAEITENWLYSPRVNPNIVEETRAAQFAGRDPLNLLFFQKMASGEIPVDRLNPWHFDDGVTTHYEVDDGNSLYLNAAERQIVITKTR